MGKIGETGSNWKKQKTKVIYLNKRQKQEETRRNRKRQDASGRNGKIQKETGRNMKKQEDFGKQEEA